MLDILLEQHVLDALRCELARKCRTGTPDKRKLDAITDGPWFQGHRKAYLQKLSIHILQPSVIPDGTGADPMNQIVREIYGGLHECIVVEGEAASPSTGLYLRVSTRCAKLRTKPNSMPAPAGRWMQAKASGR